MQKKRNRLSIIHSVIGISVYLRKEIYADLFALTHLMAGPNLLVCCIVDTYIIVSSKMTAPECWWSKSLLLIAYSEI